MTVKVRPIVQHHRHPCIRFVRRVARAISLLVRHAIGVVRQAYPRHCPIWGLHSATKEWLSVLCRYGPASSIIEYDVEDCFLNTPQDQAFPALAFWLDHLQGTTRRPLSFAISKDSSHLDHVGLSYSVHFWSLPSAVVLAAVKWELARRLDFEVLAPTGETVVLRQCRGLPIGGSLSAGLVELVALRCELRMSELPWVSTVPTARYRDNFFVAPPENWSFSQQDSFAVALTRLYGMPIKLEGFGSMRRCLELWVECLPAGPCRAVLGFRTDSARQGESGDVVAWPPWCDPRAPSCTVLLCGLAAKIVS